MRPDGWENPHREEMFSSEYLNKKRTHTGRDIIQRREQSFEAGADAMLKKLRAMGNSAGGRVFGKEAELRGNGVWVFIPEEDE